MLIDYVYQLSPITLSVIVLFGTITISSLFVWFSRRLLSIGRTEADALKIETYSDAFGIAFAILLGLIIVTAWSSYDKTDDYVKSEANYLSDLYQQSEYLNDSARQELKQNLRDYVNEVVNVEWPLLPQAKFSTIAEKYFFRTFHILYQYGPKNKEEEFVHEQMNNIATDAAEKRRSRILNAASSLTPLMWIILISSNLIAFFILALASQGPRPLHYILQVLYSVGIGLMLLLVIVLDRPFYKCGGGISDEPFRKLLHEWDRQENKIEG